MSAPHSHTPTASFAKIADVLTTATSTLPNGEPDATGIALPNRGSVVTIGFVPASPAPLNNTYCSACFQLLGAQVPHRVEQCGLHA